MTKKPSLILILAMLVPFVSCFSKTVIAGEFGDALKAALEKKNLEKKIDALEAVVATRDNEIKSLNERLKELSLELSAHRESSRKLSNRLSQQQAKTKSLRTSSSRQLSKLRVEVAEKEKQLQDAMHLAGVNLEREEQLSKLSSEVDLMREQLRQAATEKDNLRKDIREQKATISELENLATSLKSQVDRAQSTSAVDTSANDKIVSNLKEEIRIRDEKIAVQEARIKSGGGRSVDSREQSLAKLQELEKRNKALVRKNAKLKQALKLFLDGDAGETNSEMAAVPAKPSASKEEAACAETLKSGLLNPETLRIPEFSRIGPDSIKSYIETGQSTYKMQMAVVEINCIRQGSVDDTMKALCMFSQEPSDAKKLRDNIAAAKTMFENASSKYFYSLRFKSQAKGGATITSHAYCALNTSEGSAQTMILD